MTATQVTERHGGEWPDVYDIYIETFQHMLTHKIEWQQQKNWGYV